MAVIISLVVPHNAYAHAGDYFAGHYTSNAPRDQHNMILRIESSATTAILTSSVYLAATSWNSISSNVGVSVVFSAPGMSINGCTYVYGQTYTDGTLGVTSVYDYNGNPTSANSDWKYVTITMNTLSTAFGTGSEVQDRAKKTFVHEVGHALKLSHPEHNSSLIMHDNNGYPVAIMNQGYPNGIYIQSSICYHDKLNLQTKWGNKK